MTARALDSIVQGDALEFQKVSVGLSSVVHVSRMAGHKTLCGRWCWADNDHGMVYCKSCQSSLSKLKNPVSDDRKR